MLKSTESTSEDKGASTSITSSEMTSKNISPTKQTGRDQNHQLQIFLTLSPSPSEGNHHADGDQSPDILRSNKKARRELVLTLTEADEENLDQEPTDFRKAWEVENEEDAFVDLLTDMKETEVDDGEQKEKKQSGK